MKYWGRFEVSYYGSKFLSVMKELHADLRLYLQITMHFDLKLLVAGVWIFLLQTCCTRYSPHAAWGTTQIFKLAISLHSQDQCSRPCLGCHCDDLSLDFHRCSICCYCFDADTMVMMLLLDDICHWYVPWYDVGSTPLVIIYDHDDDYMLLMIVWW